MSLNQWIATAVARKAGAVENGAEFLKRGANGRTGDGSGRIPDRVPVRPCEPGEEVPQDWNPGASG